MDPSLTTRARADILEKVALVGAVEAVSAQRLVLLVLLVLLILTRKTVRVDSAREHCVFRGFRQTSSAEADDGADIFDGVLFGIFLDRLAGAPVHLNARRRVHDDGATYAPTRRMTSHIAHMPELACSAPQRRILRQVHLGLGSKLLRGGDVDPNQQMFSSRVTIEPGPSDSTVFESLKTSRWR